MTQTEFVSIAGVAMPLVVEQLKELFPSVEPRVWTLSYCTMMGVAFAVMEYAQNNPSVSEFLATTMQVGGIAFAVGTGLYKLQK